MSEMETKISKRSFWSGAVTIGLVNVPVKLYTMTYDKAFSFRFLHKQDGQPLKYERIDPKDNSAVPWEDTVRGYEVSKGHFIVFQKSELDAVRPQSTRKVSIDKFIDFFSIDPIYFEKSYILAPDKSQEAYSLLFTALRKLQKAGVGRITLKTKEYPVLLHAYKGALVLTTLRYADEISDPSSFEELKGLKEPNKKELDLAVKIVNDLSGEFDINEYEDTYAKRIRELIKKKVKGEPIIAEKPVKEEEAKGLMVSLQETLNQLKKQ